MLALTALLLLLHHHVEDVAAVVYRLNASEIAKFPPIHHLDDYNRCMLRPDALYCTPEFTLVSDTPSELLALIRNYSEHVTHFNHTRLQYGICVKDTCKKHLNDTIPEDMAVVLEACLNESLWSDYRLKTKVYDTGNCHGPDEQPSVDAGDIAIVLCLSIIVVLNVVGSLYGFYSSKEDNKFLMCFSLKHNWRRLVVPSGDGPDPRMRRLKCLAGIKTITTLLVMMGHIILPLMPILKNTHFFELVYYNPLYHVLFNGTVIVQTFFLIAGFLLVYNMEIMAEKTSVTWNIVPKGLMLRWLRLTPAYALVLGMTATLFRFSGPGPVWQRVMGDEVYGCRRNWHWHLLYLNNYASHSHCMIHSWYLAADMQLYLMGLIIYVAVKNSPKIRNRVLAVLALIGITTPALHVYIQDLDPSFLVLPEGARQLFQNYKSFSSVYIPTHTNIFGFVSGLAMGYLVYEMQKNNFDIQKYRRYKGLYHAMYPFVILNLMCCMVLYQDGPRAHILLRTFLASYLKVMISAFSFLITIGAIFKLEGLYRGILEWRGWAVPGRLCYCAYLHHMVTMRTFAVSKKTLMHSSFYELIVTYFGMVVIVFLFAVPLWFTVEAPSAQLIKLATSGNKHKKE